MISGLRTVRHQWIGGKVPNVLNKTSIINMSHLFMPCPGFFKDCMCYCVLPMIALNVIADDVNFLDRNRAPM